MSASNEYTEYHLTPAGWVDGDDKVDFRGVIQRPVPSDRILSVCFKEFVASVYSGMSFSADVRAFGSQADVVSALKAHGVEPHGVLSSRFEDWRSYVGALGFALSQG